MKTWPKFPDPVEVPTFAQNSEWAKRLRIMKNEDRREVKPFHCKKCEYPFRECICNSYPLTH